MSAFNAQKKRSGASNKHFPPFSVRFCPAYNRVGDGSKCIGSCDKLHICRRWVAGCCTQPNCKFSHSFQISQNLRVLRDAGFFVNSSTCFDKLRVLLRHLFPIVCYFYNHHVGGCSKAKCDHLHLCEERVIKGKCQKHFCRLSEAYTAPQLQPIWQKFGLLGLEAQKIEAVYHDCIAADSAGFTSECSCKLCAFMRKKSAADVSTHPAESGDSDETNSCHSSSATHDSYSGLYMQEDAPMHASYSNNGLLPLPREHSASAKPTINLNSFKSLNLRLKVPVGDPKAFASLCQADQLAAIILFLMDNRLLVPHHVIARNFGVPNGSKFVSDLKDSLGVNRPLRDKLPTVLFWHNKAYIGMINLFRICPQYCAGLPCRNPHCLFLHICKLFVAGLCPNGTSCQQSHDALNQTLFAQLGYDDDEDRLPVQKRLALIRASHPNVCASYAYGTVGSCGQMCMHLHVCNEVMLGKPCLTPSCYGRKDHNPTSNGQNKYNLTLYGLGSISKVIVTQLTIPATPRFGMDPSPHQAQVTAYPNSLNVSAMNDWQADSFAEPDSVSTHDQVSQDAFRRSVSKDMLSSDDLTVCERFLRGLCNNEESVHDGMIHFEQPFCWSYKLPRGDETAVFMKEMLRNARSFEVVDGIKWVMFEEKDNLVMETGFCNPQIRLLNRHVELTELYPFAGESEITFGSSRDDTASFRMTTRLKQLFVNPQGERTVRLRKQVEMEVRCFRTRSLALSTSNCVRSTNWCWYFKNQNSENSDDLWTDCKELVGENVLEIEYAFATGQNAVTLQARKQRKTYLFDFDTMLVICDEDSLQSDLCSRPKFLPLSDV